MTSTYDHRVIQGAESGSFLRRDRRAAPGRGRLLRRRVRGARPRRPWSRASAGRRRRDRRRAGARRRHARRRRRWPDAALLQAVQAATSLVKAHRMHGHLAARLDPLGSAAARRPGARPGDGQPHRGADAAHPGVGAARGGARARPSPTRCPHLRETYAGTIAYEIEHISDHEQRVWLRQAIESGTYRAAARPRGEAAAARAAVAGRGARDLPAQGLPRQEAVLDRGPRRARADARRGDRAGLRRAAPARS